MATTPASASSDGPPAPGPAGLEGRVYLDHASTSPLRPVAAAAMWQWLSAADPGRVHTEGRMSRAALEEAREQVAALFGTRSRQVIFTSGATESINAATFGALRSSDGGTRSGAVAAAAVEHSAVQEASARWGSEVVPIGVDRDGLVDPDEVEGAVASGEVRLVHCQLANHEVGSVQPVAEVVARCRRRGAMVHVDAAAAGGHVRIDFDSLGADLLSVSAHKLGGPRGSGALLVRRGLRVAPLLVGGAQERARRGGLEDVPAAVGFGAAAAELGGGRLEDEARRAARRVAALERAARSIPGVTVYGPGPDGRLPHLLCVGVEGVEAEAVLIGLDQSGVAAHSGSACSSESLEPSPVLRAMGVDADRSLRLSVGWSTTDADIERAAAALPAVVGRLRALRAEG